MARREQQQEFESVCTLIIACVIVWNAQTDHSVVFLAQDASIQAEGRYRLDVLGEFTGRASRRRLDPKLAWTAELERSSRQGWAHQRQLRAKLAHDSDRVQLDWEAWQR